MIERWTDETTDPADARFARAASGVLARFNAAGILTAADVHVAARTAALVGGVDEETQLAVALAVRAARAGSVCVDLDDLTRTEPDLPWPPPGWLARVGASRLAGASVLRVEGDLLYLDRYWREEGQVRDDLLVRETLAPPPTGSGALAERAERLFPGVGYAEQRAAALSAVGQWTTVLTGGPGTGKTTTVAGLLALIAAESPVPLRIALTAPTGKAAARLQEAVTAAQQERRFSDDDRARLAGLTASTMHRLLGWRPGSSTRFAHHRGNRLPHDVIVVDETSMVSLTMMARLLEAVRPDTRLILVGDPDQLASVEAGAVLADLATGLAERGSGAVVGLRTTHRFGEGIGDLAQALRDGDADRVLALLEDGSGRLRRIDPQDEAAMSALRGRLSDHAAELRRLSLAGDAAGAVATADDHRLLCAHRDGPWGALHWNRQIDRALADRAGTWLGEWYAGRPILVTTNDYSVGLFNGDTGVAVVAGDGALRVHIAGGRTYAPSRLGDVETLHAMTVHKSQGSQAREVSVLLPPADSPLLTRELFYTAVTRAQERVTVIGSRESVAAAVTRRAQRASGLRRRLSEA
ncbi:exodeoxyribonuclease V subunit alpha [Nocardioides sp. BP30]|uniref:exodeoxyribonuclease V subunit alpha n=1 Tax=Nocardioides sp. BP30 TaxID=3036374 RepID=UPI0024687E50|nr:exodeoxyribonuclease V subunit alpha [Nocardioides sp. BP30]WGL52388.1 exodeoxyribonuclease V subunit alpha [Nocardioides sp. BP30]